MDYRGNSKTVYWGISRAGKSVTAKMVSDTLVKKYEKELGQGVRVFAHDPQGRFKDICTDYVSDQEAFSDYVILEDGQRPVVLMANSIVIIDELPDFFDNGRVTKIFKKFMGLASENNIEVIFICHHPTQCPPQVAINITHAIVYYTGGGEDKLDTEKFQNAELAKKSVLVIREYLNQYPSGTHGLGDYPNFPYAFIDLLGSKVKFVNMPLLKHSGKTIEVPYNPESDPDHEQYKPEKYDKYKK